MLVFVIHTRMLSSECRRNQHAFQPGTWFEVFGAPIGEKGFRCAERETARERKEDSLFSLV